MDIFLYFMYLYIINSNTLQILISLAFIVFVICFHIIILLCSSQNGDCYSFVKSACGGVGPADR